MADDGAKMVDQSCVILISVHPSRAAVSVMLSSAVLVSATTSQA